MDSFQTDSFVQKKWSYNNFWLVQWVLHADIYHPDILVDCASIVSGTFGIAIANSKEEVFDVRIAIY